MESKLGSVKGKLPTGVQSACKTTVYQQRSASPMDLRVGSLRHTFQLAAAIRVAAVTEVLPTKLLFTCTKMVVV